MPIVEFYDQAEARAFYTSPAWRKLRADHLRRHPRCVFCGRPGRTVDHKQKRRLVPALALDPRNLQTNCRKCHDSIKRHHEAEDLHPLGGGVGADGFPLAAAHPWRSGNFGAVAPKSGAPGANGAGATDRPRGSSRFASKRRF